MRDDPFRPALPDDIEQFLLIGQHERVTNALMERLGITREVVAFWSGGGCFTGGEARRPRQTTRRPEPIGC